MKSALTVCQWLLGGMLPWLVCGCAGEQPTPLVVYCSHDADYAQSLLDRFTEETGIPVAVKYDTEATKSLGLVNLLLAEQAHPRCDVFWNNQVLGTVELQHAGVLSPYKGPGYERIPDRFKDPAGHWTGFAARLRVYIVNTDHMDATEAAVAERLTGDLSRMAIAKPIYGTTLTHYSLMWHLLGEVEFKRWHADNLQRGQQVLASNGQVKNLVAAGTCDFGWTDTDDFFVAKDDQQPVAMLPIRIQGATISIPNSVCIIQGTQQRTNAERLVDFLLSEATEVALSQSAARQIPLGTVDAAQLSEEVLQLRVWAADGYDLSQIVESHHACLEWLKLEYLR